MSEKITEKTPEERPRPSEIIFRIILFVLLTGAVVFLAATFVVGPLTQESTLLTVESRIDASSHQYNVVVYLDYRHNLTAERSLADIEDRLETPNYTPRVGGDRVLLPGVLDGKVGNGTVPHPVEEYLPMVYELSTGRLAILSGQHEQAIALSPNGAIAVLEFSQPDSSGVLQRTYRVVDVTDISDPREVTRFMGRAYLGFYLTFDGKFITANEASGGITCWINTTTGEQRELRLFEHEGGAKITLPDPLGGGVYFFEKGQVFFRDFATDADVFIAEIPQPQFFISPDGSTLLYMGGASNLELIAQSIQTGETWQVTSDVKNVVINNGHLLVTFKNADLPARVIEWQDVSFR